MAVKNTKTVKQLAVTGWLEVKHNFRINSMNNSLCKINVSIIPILQLAITH